MKRFILSNSSKNGLIKSLGMLQFSNAEEIVQTALEAPGPTNPVITGFQYLVMLDPLAEREGIQLEIYAKCRLPIGDWQITHMSATQAYNLATPPYGERAAKASTYFDQELLNRKELLWELRENLALARVKDELKLNCRLKTELDSIGFYEYDQLVDSATAFLTWTHLHKTVYAPETIGTGQDRVDFVITLTHEKNGKPQMIQSIIARYDSPLGLTYEDQKGSERRYYRKAGKFPTVDKMLEAVIRAERDRLLDYARAYKISSKLQMIRDNIITEIKKLI